MIYENMTKTAANHECIATVVVSYNQKGRGWQLDELEQYDPHLSAMDRLRINQNIC